MGKTTEKTIEIKAIKPAIVTVTIEGTTDLILNKMNDVTARQLIDVRKDKAKSTEKPNEWEAIITSIHWFNGKPTDFSEEGLKDALTNNKPCITAFGLKKAMADTVVRNEIATYSTKFNASVNIISKGGVIPITFAEHYIDEKLMSPKKGAPVLVHLNRFTGWKAEVEFQIMENVYSVEQIVNILNLCGFGCGIGSGRSSGYGRFSVTDVK